MYLAVNIGKLSGNGEFTKKCQAFLEARYGFKKCLLTTSCTDALEMAAILCDIQPGDEVIVPSYTFVSTADAFVLRGAKAVFVDIRPDTMNIDDMIEAEKNSGTNDDGDFFGFFKIRGGLLSLTCKRMEIFNQQHSASSSLAAIHTITGRVDNCDEAGFFMGNILKYAGKIAYHHDDEVSDPSRWGDGVVSVDSAHILDTALNSSPYHSGLATHTTIVPKLAPALIYDFAPYLSERLYIESYEEYVEMFGPGEIVRCSMNEDSSDDTSWEKPFLRVGGEESLSPYGMYGYRNQVEKDDFQFEFTAPDDGSICFLCDYYVDGTVFSIFDLNQICVYRSDNSASIKTGHLLSLLSGVNDEDMLDAMFDDEDSQMSDTLYGNVAAFDLVEGLQPEKKYTFKGKISRAAGHEKEPVTITSFVAGAYKTSDKLHLEVNFAGRTFESVDPLFEEMKEGINNDVDVVIRPEDISVKEENDKHINGVVESIVFKGVHYEIIVNGDNNVQGMIHDVDPVEIGQRVGLTFEPDDIHVMRKSFFSPKPGSFGVNDENDVDVTNDGLNCCF